MRQRGTARTVSAYSTRRHVAPERKWVARLRRGGWLVGKSATGWVLAAMMLVGTRCCAGPRVSWWVVRNRVRVGVRRRGSVTTPCGRRWADFFWAQITFNCVACLLIGTAAVVLASVQVFNYLIQMFFTLEFFFMPQRFMP